MAFGLFGKRVPEPMAPAPAIMGDGKTVTVRKAEMRLGTTGAAS